MSKNSGNQNLECLKLWLTTLKHRKKKEERPERLAPRDPDKGFIRIRTNN